MQNQNDIFRMVEEWAEPYSPFIDNSLDKRNESMESYSKILTEYNIEDIVKIGLEIYHTPYNEDLLYTYSDFIMGYYLRFHEGTYLIEWLCNKLTMENVFPVVPMIGRIGNPELLPFIIEKIDFSKLPTETKHWFLTGIGYLKNCDYINYLKQLISEESNQEVKEDIEICLSNFQNHCKEVISQTN